MQVRFGAKPEAAEIMVEVAKIGAHTSGCLLQGPSVGADAHDGE